MSDRQSDLPVAAVLAGGRARRMGGSKALLGLGDRHLIDYPISALQAAGLPTVVVCKAGTALPELDIPIWREASEPVHPLCGILTALRRGGGRPILACGCDMPFVTAELAAWLALRPGPVVVPKVGETLQPLLALYRPEVVDRLDSALARRLSLRGAVQELDPTVIPERELRRFGEPQELFFNVNTREDLDRAEKLLS